MKKKQATKATQSTPVIATPVSAKNDTADYPKEWNLITAQVFNMTAKGILSMEDFLQAADSHRIPRDKFKPFVSAFLTKMTEAKFLKIVTPNVYPETLYTRNT